MDNIASQRHHAPKGIEEVGNSAQASRRRLEAAVCEKAPQTNDGQNVEGVGRRARAILEQQELANPDGFNEVREDIPQITQGPEVYVSHRWSRPAGEKLLNKRAVQSRQVTNVKKLGAVYSVIGDEETGDTRRNNSSHKRRLDENKGSIPTEEEKAPETFAEAAEIKVWRDSMTAEVKALQNRGCWRVFRNPSGVRLIKSKFIFELKKDWTGKFIKRKSRLVVLGCLQKEGVDYEETFAPVAKNTTFPQKSS